MYNFILDASHGSLIQQVIQAISQAVADGHLSPGYRLPSVRQFARQQGISTFTVAEAYSRLVQQGQLQARRGDGYYVIRPVWEKPTPAIQPLDTLWLTDHRINPDASSQQPGCGWLPDDWYPNEELARALRLQGRGKETLVSYGTSAGWLPLRQHLFLQLNEQGIPASLEGLILTQGASQALTLVVQGLLPPGCTVLVDDPGYCNLLALLQHAGIRAIGVPWTPQGPDCNLLAQLLNTTGAVAFFTNPRLHNPTGASYCATTAFKVLQLTAQAGCLIVVDDVSAGLCEGGPPPLAALAGFEHLIHIGSYSKTLAPSLRVGYLLTSPERSDRLLRYKVMTGLASSELNERLVLQLESEPRVRRGQERLQDRLRRAGERWQRGLEAIGWESFCPPSTGFFSWIRLPGDGADSKACAKAALGKSMLLAPGSQFRVDGQDSPWIRCNLAYSHQPLLDFLAEWGERPSES